MARIVRGSKVSDDQEPQGFHPRLAWWTARLEAEFREKGYVTLPRGCGIPALLAYSNLAHKIEKERRNGKNPTLSIVR